MFKEWFFFPRSDRRAILLLAVLLIIMVCFLWWKSEYAVQSDVIMSEEDSLAFVSLMSVSHNSNVYRTDSIEKNKVKNNERNSQKKPYQIKLQTNKWDRIDKFQKDTILDLNTADTLLLKRIPGIGSWRARRIVEFRGHLGGYSKIGQLLEINGMPDSLLRWFAIYTPPQRVLNLNCVTVDEMAAHPYITYKQARVILRHKRLYGPLQSLDQLSLYEEFSQKELERLEPYVNF